MVRWGEGWESGGGVMRKSLLLLCLFSSLWVFRSHIELQKVVYFLLCMSSFKLLKILGKELSFFFLSFSSWYLLSSLSSRFIRIIIIRISKNIFPHGWFFLPFSPLIPRCFKAFSFSDLESNHCDFILAFSSLFPSLSFNLHSGPVSPSPNPHTPLSTVFSSPRKCLHPSQ